MSGISGHNALFATLVDKHQPRKTVNWITKEKSVATEDYFRQCLREAQSKGVPLALRQGGGNDIGFVGISPKMLPPIGSVLRNFSGSPNFGCLMMLSIFFKLMDGVNPPSKPKSKEEASYLAFSGKSCCATKRHSGRFLALHR